MSTQDVEAIRQRLVSLLVDSQALKRKTNRLRRGKNRDEAEAVEALKQLADRIDRSTRELYHLLPEHLRPNETPRPQKPREPRHDGEQPRDNPGPKPGGAIPREVRWPEWTIAKILELADTFKQTHGKWPNGDSGRISDTSPDTWNGIDLALRRGNRNLPGGTSLSRLLSEHRGIMPLLGRPPFEVNAILSWADEHYSRTGNWPSSDSGPVAAAKDEVWSGVDRALRRGLRGLPGDSSLARLLSESRDVLNLLGQPLLTEVRILSWADAYQSRTGEWPTRNSGDIPEESGENWKRINTALIKGHRSLPGGSSLARFLAEHRGVRNRKALPHYELEQILLWADLHYEKHHRWPTCWGGEIEDAPGESWRAIDSAFKAGVRGLAGSEYRSLAHLLDERRGKLKRRGARPAERVSS